MVMFWDTLFEKMYGLWSGLNLEAGKSEQLTSWWIWYWLTQVVLNVGITLVYLLAWLLQKLSIGFHEIFGSGRPCDKV